MSSTNATPRRKLSMALLKEMPCIVQPRLEQAVGSNAARITQQIYYWSLKPYSDPILGEIKVRTFFGRRWVNIPPAFFNNPFRGAFRHWSQSTIDRGIADAKRDGILRTDSSLGGEYNINWYCVYEEHVGLLNTIYDDFDAQFEREWRAVLSDEKAKIQRLPKARQDAIWQTCKRHLDAAKKQCFARTKTDAAFEADAANAASAAWHEIVTDVSDEEIEDFFEFYQIDGTATSRGQDAKDLIPASHQFKTGRPSNRKDGSINLSDPIPSERENGSINLTELPLYTRTREEQQQNFLEQQQEHSTPEIFTEPPSSDVVVVAFSNSSESQQPNEVKTETPSEHSSLIKQMTDIGVSQGVARQLVRDPDACRRQLEFLPDRASDDPAATLVASIRGTKDAPGEWAAPKAWVKRQKAQQSAEKTRAAQEQRQAEEAQRQAAQQAQNEHLKKTRAYLDAIWDGLDAEDRALVKQTALKLNEGETSKLTFDRIKKEQEIPILARYEAIEHLLDERMLMAPEEEPGAASQSTEVPQPQAVSPAQTGASDDEQLDMIWNTLPEMVRARIENEAHVRLGVMPENTRTQGALVAMRRALLRDWFATLQPGAETPKTATKETPQTHRKTG